ncbi:DNA-binding protein [Klebsiella variicola]|uniref:DNA-binding protein n=1 Tax=Klebsiella variicola TaxID=244366 RepID=UPI001CDAEBEB|nr:DNA-binding protein [Klebsiella variicola]
MPSLGQLYNDKESGLTTRKTYNVPIASIYAEEGYNVRELNQAHVDEFRDAFIAGEYIPPLAVEVTERGVKVIDGHHRYHGALAAIAMGHDIVRLECKDFVGTEADILQHLQLHECTPYIKKLVRDGSMNYAIAIGISREHGVYADREAARLMKKAEAAGKTKVTKSIAKPQFNAGKARKFLEIISSCKEITSGGLIIEVPPAMQAEVLSILQEFRYETSAPKDDEQPNDQTSSSEESDAA